MGTKVNLNKDNCKILVCCHKPCELPPNPDDLFLPIQVGAAISNVDLEMQRDDMVNGKPCDNISAKNKSYCELTALYWAWKNIKKIYPNLEYIGMNHYRRYFSFDRKFSVYEDTVKDESEVNRYELNKNRLQKILCKNRIIISRKHFYKFSMFFAYCLFYVSEDYRILKQTIQYDFPDFYEPFIKCMEKSNYYSPYNMFVMKFSEFSKYCEWLFNVLSKIERKIPFKYYTQQQMRVFGYMSEFLLRIYLYKNSNKIHENIVSVYRDDIYLLNPILQIFKTLRNKLIFFILKNF